MERERIFNPLRYATHADPPDRPDRRLLRAYQVTGHGRWFEAAEPRGDLLAEKWNPDPKADPWLRFVNPETAP